MAVVGAACTAIAIFEGVALLGAAAALSGAGAVFAGRFLASERQQVYQGAVGTLGVLFLAGLGFGLGSVLDLYSVRREGDGPAISASAPTQPARKAHIRGVVNDGAGLPIAKAQISLVGPLTLSTPSQVQLTTDEMGRYEFETDSLGTYELSVFLEGFETLSWRLGVDAVGLDVGVLTLRAIPAQEMTTEVLGVTENLAGPPPPSPTTRPTSTLAPSAGLPSSSVPAVATATPRATRSPTRVVTMNPRGTSTPVPTATLLGGRIAPRSSPTSSPKPTSVTSRYTTPTPTRTATRTPAR
ncbi:MAG TPA: carboxypeptidase-like regulatory domain-containing protein [Dehalococcoidia bacterium]|nr:carboxypeptidase-like regulatory domain-containing protein [Dehalococcoidia bacterium]